MRNQPQFNRKAMKSIGFFRGKSTGNLGAWIFGYYHYDKKLNEHYICDEESLYRFDVTTESIGQFTGVIDKNGKRLYDKDIIRSFDSTGGEIRHVIKWVTEEACYKLYAPNYDTDSGSLNQEWVITYEKEVIGNAIDNPDLMVKNKKNTGKC